MRCVILGTNGIVGMPRGFKRDKGNTKEHEGTCGQVCIIAVEMTYQWHTALQNYGYRICCVGLLRLGEGVAFFALIDFYLLTTAEHKLQVQGLFRDLKQLN